MQPQYLQAAQDVALKSPLIFVICLLAALLGALICVLVWGAWKGVPRLLDWIEKRQEAGHVQQNKLLTDLRSDADKDIARSDKAVSDAHVVIGAKVEAVSGKVEAMHSDVRRIAAKLGAVSILLALCGWAAFSFGSRLVVRTAIILAAKCEPPCPEGQRCKTAIPRTCVEDKKGKEAQKPKDEKTASKPSSAIFKIGQLAQYAVNVCDSRVCEG